MTAFGTAQIIVSVGWQVLFSGVPSSAASRKDIAYRCRPRTRSSGLTERRCSEASKLRTVPDAARQVGDAAEPGWTYLVSGGRSSARIASNADQPQNTSARPVVRSVTRPSVVPSASRLTSTTNRLVTTGFLSVVDCCLAFLEPGLMLSRTVSANKQPYISENPEPLSRSRSRPRGTAGYLRGYFAELRQKCC